MVRRIYYEEFYFFVLIFIIIYKRDKDYLFSLELFFINTQ